MFCEDRRSSLQQLRSAVVYAAVQPLPDVDNLPSMQTTPASTLFRFVVIVIVIITTMQWSRH